MNEGKKTSDVSEELVFELEQTQEVSFGKRDRNEYQRFVKAIDTGFKKASDAFIIIGCALWNIHHNEYYRIDNYKNIAEFALDRYELKKSTTHNYINVVEKFGELKDGKALGIKDAYKDFSYSQLVAMLSLTPEQLEAVLPDWSVRKIVGFGKELPLLHASESGIESDDTADVESDSSTFTSDSPEEYLTAPEIVTGRTLLGEFTDFDEIEKQRDVFISAYENMRKDKNFKNKNVRIVLELAFD